MTTKIFSMFIPIIPILLLIFQLVGSGFTESTDTIITTDSKTKPHVNQEKACEEYEKCCAGRAKDVNSLKTIKLGPDTVEINVDKHICAYKSNCRKVRRALCKDHMGPTGNIGMKIICQITWLGGSDETDATDPITASNIEPNQTMACSNYQKCYELPDEGLVLLGLHPFVENNKELFKKGICADMTNCCKEKMALCNNEIEQVRQTNDRVSKLALLFCAITWYKEEEEKRPIGSRSLGGGGLRNSQLALAQVCPSAAHGVCSLF